MVLVDCSCRVMGRLEMGAFTAWLTYPPAVIFGIVTITVAVAVAVDVLVVFACVVHVHTIVPNSTVVITVIIPSEA